MLESFAERLTKTVLDLSEDDAHALLGFAEYLSSRHDHPSVVTERLLSETEHARILAGMDQVAGLSVKAGPPVNNRDHDQDLYGKR